MTRTIFRTALRSVFLLLIAGAFSAAANAQEYEDKTLSPYFFVNGDPNVDRLPLKNTSVDISVSGVIADVRVVQTYKNEGTRPINARYVFPASTRAAVYSMRMKIGDEVIYAKIREREQAKQEFEKAKAEGKSASLLEENRPNVFQMSMANLMPQEQIDIELRYTELLIPTDGVYEVVYPTVVGPRYPSKEKDGTESTEKWVESPYLHEGNGPTSTLHISARIAAGVPIRNLACSSHNVTPQWDDPSVARLSLDNSDVFGGNRDFVLSYSLIGEQITSGLMLYQGPDENFFLYMAQPPKRIAPDQIPPREYIFVVDVSGSMAGFPLDTSKKLLEDLIGELRPTDLFNVVLFAGDSTVLSEQSLPASQENISRAIELLDKQDGMGGTELNAAMTRAMAMPRAADVSRSIVLVTDGYISAEKDVFDQIRSNLNKCNVFAFGIGSGVNRYLIEGVAHAGMGEPFIVTDEKDAAATADRFREYIRSPVLTDVRINAFGFDTYDVYPAVQADLLAQRPVIMFGKWRGPVTGTIELQGKTGLGDYMSTFDISQVRPDEANSGLRYLWARSRIAELSDYGSGDVSDADIRQITDLGLKYNLLTRYTSFIAVREKVVNPNGSADNVNQPLPLPVGVSDLAIGSEPEFVWLLSALSAIAIVLLARRRWQFGNVA